jgi:Fe-S cluster assembly protein SufD
MTDVLARQFETFSRNGGIASPEWLRLFRQRAFDRFHEVGFPSPKDEEWRFTPVAPIARTEFELGPAAQARVTLADLEPYAFGHLDWPRLVFVDGLYVADLSVPPNGLGVTLRPLSLAIAWDPEVVQRALGRHASIEATPFAALNAAFVREGAVVDVAAAAAPAHPVHLLFVTTTAAADVALHPRVLVRVGADARVQIIESYVTLAPGTRYLTNAVTEMAVGPNAWVEHTRIQRESEGAYHVGFTQVDQDGESHYRSFALAMGGALARHNLHARLGAPNAESLLYGLYLAHDEQLIDNHTAIHHDQPNCRSWEVYKGVLDDRAHGVFNGKIFVKPDAQRTDAKQTNRALLLSDEASVDTKPQLEIFADDVKCTHGAAVGQIDEQAYFYVQSRGVARSAARRLLTYAFAAEVVHEVASEPVRAALERLVAERLTRVV